MTIKLTIDSGQLTMNQKQPNYNRMTIKLTIDSGQFTMNQPTKQPLNDQTYNKTRTGNSFNNSTTQQLNRSTPQHPTHAVFCSSTCISAFMAAFCSAPLIE
jgi:hypothetical protein